MPVSYTHLDVYKRQVQAEHNLRLYDTALDMAAINKALVVQDVVISPFYNAVGFQSESRIILTQSL